MTIATLIEKLQEDISWLGYNETEREIIEHIKYAITLLKEQEARKKNRLPYSPDSNVQWT
jgi:hypothetical protein